ncbi:hydrolase 76 protein [Globomyces sp. JEL0801]|nr:hydrolase 76 protein [Globomyces sp. JEL0801]
MKLELLSLASISLAAISIDVNSRADVLKSTQALAKNLMGYYPKPAFDGAIQNITFYESGIFWGVMMDYVQATGDQTYSTLIVNAITLASDRKSSNFLGSSPAFAETWLGVWNDDLLWWAMPAMTGAEIYGKDTMMPGGVTYGALSAFTTEQIWKFWDPSCGGGIFWFENSTLLILRARDKSNKDAGKKTVITNAQEIMMKARMSLATGDKTLAQHASQIYTWLKARNLVKPTWHVADGLDANAQCRVIETEHSYKNGILMAALAWLYKASNDPAHLSDAHNIARTALATFTKRNIITDLCEPNCESKSVPPKGTFIRGLGYLFDLSPDAALKASIKAALKDSVIAMLNSCDSQYNCGTNWSIGSPSGPNLRYTINSLELMTAYLKTFGVPPTKFQPPTSPPPTPVVPIIPTTTVSRPTTTIGIKTSTPATVSSLSPAPTNGQLILTHSSIILMIPFILSLMYF